MLIELQDDIWKYWKKGYWLVCTTNGIVGPDGKAVMGGGIALATAQKFPHLPRAMAKKLHMYGNMMFTFPDEGIITLPTKEHYKDPSTLERIEKSLRELEYTCTFQKRSIFGQREKIVMPRLGCGLGGLKWEEVRPLVDTYAEKIGYDKIAVVDRV